MKDITINELLELDLPVFKKAYKMASIIHINQKRWDGTPICENRKNF